MTTASLYVTTKILSGYGINETMAALYQTVNTLLEYRNNKTIATLYETINLLSGYGSNETTAAFYERGPHFVVQPGNTIVVGSVRPIALDCVAVGNPQPRFTWYEMNATYSNPTLHHMSTYQEITSSMDSRYTFTNGRLTISHPRETTDAGTYQCKAENQFGSILSEPMALTFGCKLVTFTRCCGKCVFGAYVNSIYPDQPAISKSTNYSKTALARTS